MDVAIRIASPRDRDSVTTLLRMSYPTLMRHAYELSILEAALPSMTVAQPTLLQSGSYYVAETAKESIVGCGGWTRERPGTREISPGVGHIRHFGVHPEWTRRGVGRAIYDRCRTDAKTAGLKRLECYSSLNGEAFYAAVGFESLDRMDVAMPDDVDFPSVHMVAEI